MWNITGFRNMVTSSHLNVWISYRFDVNVNKLCSLSDQFTSWAWPSTRIGYFILTVLVWHSSQSIQWAADLGMYWHVSVRKKKTWKNGAFPSVLLFLVSFHFFWLCSLAWRARPHVALNPLFGKEWGVFWQRLNTKGRGTQHTDRRCVPPMP